MLSASISLSSPGFMAVLTKSGPGFVWSIAMLAALVYALWSAHKSGLSARAMYWAVVSSLLAGLWGAHLLSLLVHGWEGGPLALFQFVQGGKSLYGGLLLGGIGGGIYFSYRRLPVLAYADAAMPALALGYAIGRVGCFLNGDDYGTLTSVPWAVVYPPGTEAYAAHLARGWIDPGASVSLPIHPVQLYASLVGLTLFAFLAKWRPPRHGERLCAYLALYGLARFMLEWLRGDFNPVLGPFSLPQIFSGMFMVFGLAFWLRLRHTRQTASVNVAAGSDAVASDAYVDDPDKPLRPHIGDLAPSPVPVRFDGAYESLHATAIMDMTP